MRSTRVSRRQAAVRPTSHTAEEHHDHARVRPAPRPGGTAVSARGVAVVTGGSAGVGRSAVRALAERGWDVAVLARGKAGTEAAADEVTAAGRRGLAVLCDVADPDQVEAAADRVESELGPIDVWVNVAFSGSLSYFWDTA